VSDRKEAAVGGILKKEIPVQRGKMHLTLAEMVSENCYNLEQLLSHSTLKKVKLSAFM